QNNDDEEHAADQSAKIYDGVQRQLYLLLGATLVAIVLTSLYLILSNRKIFARLELLSAQRSELAQKLIHTQESTLRHISRELHDEFVQVLTAIGVLLGRAGVQVYRIAQEALNNISRHAGVQEAWVRLMYQPDALVLEVEDHGKGISAQKDERGIGLVAMRERAELINGNIEYLQSNGRGTLVRMIAPREKVESHGG